tara:strand:+ start:266 stop:802 length:537 start_codon:yes stop_codon:yes gene_type:complete
MDLYEIHQEMKNECGDAQERFAMEEELDPLRSPLPKGGNEWEKGFMESMKKAKKYGWTLSPKQIATVDRIRSDEEYERKEREEYYASLCSTCEMEGYTCSACREKEEEADMGHMSAEEREAWYDFCENVLADRDVMSGSYGSVPSFRGACPLSYNSSGYSGGRGYHVKINKYTGMTEW